MKLSPGIVGSVVHALYRGTTRDGPRWLNSERWTLTSCEIWTRFDFRPLICPVGLQWSATAPLMAAIKSKIFRSISSFRPLLFAFNGYNCVRDSSFMDFILFSFVCVLNRGGHLNQNWCDVKLTDELFVHSLVKCNLWLPKMKFHFFLRFSSVCMHILDVMFVKKNVPPISLDHKCNRFQRKR